MEITRDWRTSKRIDQKMGKCCSDCGIYFKHAHGEPVICESCKTWRESRGLPINLPVVNTPIIGIEDLTPQEIARILFNGRQSEVNMKKVRAKYES